MIQTIYKPKIALQLNHHDTKFKKQKHPITLVCDNITNAPNIGSLIRVADAFNVDELIFCGSHTFIGKRITKTSRSAEKYVNYSLQEDINLVIKDLKANDYFLIALEITQHSKQLTEFRLITKQPIALVLGDENFGISESLLTQVDVVLHINMFGNNSSMNVVQAASIGLYELTKQLNS